MSPGDLEKALCGLEFPTNANVLLGLNRPDDAGIYKVSEDLAIIQTLDFFTPIVDDPFVFGQIAAANALSDIYAKGGIPKTAMNIVCFSSQTLSIDVLRDILNGGISKIREAEAVILGGHSVEDKELKYGLSVTGFIHPKRIFSKTGLCINDKLVLTKPIGTGIINTAIKAGLADQSIIQKVSYYMTLLNRSASEVMIGLNTNGGQTYPVHACTDITGFGLIGHLAEMLEDSSLSVCLNIRDISIYPEAISFARMGFIPGGAYRNFSFRKSMMVFSDSLDSIMPYILFDPQTSGGLLMSVNPSIADELISQLHHQGLVDASIIGHVVSGNDKKIFVE